MTKQIDRAGQMRRTRPEQLLRTPQPERSVTEDQHQRKGGEQMKQFGCLINTPQHDHFDQRAEHRDDQCGGQHGEPEAARRLPETAGNAIGDVNAEHIERAVREVDDARHAEDQ
jgi:hypothetical protein